MCCDELFTFTNQGEKTEGSPSSYSGHHLPSRCEQIPICIRHPNLTLAYFFLWDPLVEDAESSAHCFLGWFLQTRPRCLPHLCFSLLVLPGREATCLTMGEAPCVFAWHPGQWRHGCLCWGGTLRASHEVPEVVCRAGSAQLAMAGTDRRRTDLLQFLSANSYAGFFPLCFGTGTSLVPLHHCLWSTSECFAVMKSLWLRHNWAVSLP